MRSVRYGCRRTRSHSPAPSGPRLSQIAFETPSRPRSCTRPARRSVRTSSSGSPSCRPRLGRELGDRARVAERVRRLEVDEVRDRQQRRVEALAGQHDRERRLGVDHRVPGADRVEPAEDRRRRRRRRASASAGSNCLPLRSPRERRRPRRPRRRGARPRRTRRAARAAPRAGSSSPASSPGQPRPSHRSYDAAERVEHRRRAARAARPARARSRRAGRSCRRPRGARRARTRARPGSGAAAGSPAPSSRIADRHRRAGCAARGRTWPPSARCRRRTTSPARARRSGSRR